MTNHDPLTDYWFSLSKLFVVGVMLYPLFVDQLQGAAIASALLAAVLSLVAGIICARIQHTRKQHVSAATR